VSLLGATLVEDGLLVEFATTAPGKGWIEYSEVHEPPSVWRRLGVVPPGTIEVRLPGRYIAGSRVRLVSGGDPATAVTSQIVLVADLAGATSAAAVAGSRPRLTVETLLGDSAPGQLTGSRPAWPARLVHPGLPQRGAWCGRYAPSWGDVSTEARDRLSRRAASTPGHPGDRNGR
jgi:hypothetical protein